MADQETLFDRSRMPAGPHEIGFVDTVQALTWIDLEGRRDWVGRGLCCCVEHNAFSTAPKGAGR